MRISDWSSDVCSSDLRFRRYIAPGHARAAGGDDAIDLLVIDPAMKLGDDQVRVVRHDRPVGEDVTGIDQPLGQRIAGAVVVQLSRVGHRQHRYSDGLERELFVNWHLLRARSEEHTSELPSLMRTSYAV